MKENMDRIIQAYEKATNSHVWANVEPFVHPDASYFFTDGTHIGREEVRKAVVETFDRIEEEIYTIKNVKWIVTSEILAVCTYNFQWKGFVDGIQKEGSGRGTNVWKNTDGQWQIIHEHLSKGLFK